MLDKVRSVKYNVPIPTERSSDVNMKRRIGYLTWLAAVLFCGIGGFFLAGERAWAYLSVALAVLALLPAVWGFEKRKHKASELTVLAALVAFTAASRIALFALPGVKPVTAAVILVSVYMGKEAGFATGALSALVSGFAFGLGSFTPFQMLAWGGCGFLAGWLGKLLQKRIPLLVFGALSGALFSVVMELWTVASAYGNFSINLYLGSLAASLPTTALYAGTNVVFLALLQKPAIRIFGRLKKKYGVFVHFDETF